MFGRTRQRSMLQEVAFGAVAGLVGTWTIGKAFEVMQKMSSGKDEPEAPQEGEDKEERQGGTQLLAERMYRMVGSEPTPEKKQKLGKVIHWSYGIGWGALYGVIRNRIPQLSWGMGIPFGLAFGALSSEMLLAITGLAPPPPKVSAKQHVQGLAAHVAYALAADGSYRALERTFGQDHGRIGRALNSARRRLR